MTGVQTCALPICFQSAQQFAEALDNWARTGQPVTVPPEHRSAHQAAVAMTPMPRAPGVPEIGVAATEQPPPPVGAGSEAMRLTGTAVANKSNQSWATSQHDAVAGLPKASKGPAIALASVIGVIVVGGGFGAYQFLLAGPAKTETTVIAPPPPKAAEPAPTPAVPPSPPPATIEATEDRTTAEAKPTETAPSATAAKPAPAPPPVVRPTGRPTPRPAPPPAKPPSKTSGTPDFGY